MKAAFLLLVGAALASAQTVYLIRHGEKPADDDDPNLSAQGVQRAQCLRNVFGASSQYNIQYIIAEKPKGMPFFSDNYEAACVWDSDPLIRSMQMAPEFELLTLSLL